VVIGDGIDWIWNDSRDRLHFTLEGGMGGFMARSTFQPV
jgi:hypothetical protein